MVTYEQICNDAAIRTYIERADRSLLALGYTEHNIPHVTRVATVAGDILQTLNMPERQVELARIAGHLHDIGNVINRIDHSQSGAVMAFRLLDRYGMPPEEICTVAAAIGNHDEGSGVPVDEVSAALILADKSDVRRTRVRNADLASFDIHDRVNYSVTQAQLQINSDKTEIELCLTIDTKYGSIMEFFEIFLERMKLCRRAAERLGLRFRVRINDQLLL